MSDLRVCDSCGYKASGYGFVAFVQGTDPRVCPQCKKPMFRAATLWDKIKMVFNR